MTGKDTRLDKLWTVSLARL